LLGEVVVVRLDWGWSTAVNSVGIVDETIIIGLLNPFVDDASGPRANHLFSENCTLISEGSFAPNIAASFGEKDRDVVACGHSLEVDVSGRVVCRRTTPFVRIEAIKIDNLIRFRATGKIILEHGSQFGDISGRVSNGDLSVFLGGHICLHIGGSSLDIWRCERASGSVDDFISDPESSQVVVFLEDVHDFGESEELLLGPCRIGLLDGGIEGIEIQPNVDSCVRKGLHTSVMGGIRVDMVDTDRVGAN
jgi:hypothetical protein